MKLAAVVLMLLGAALCAEAKEMPKVQTQAKTDASVLAPAAFKQPNRIYIENGRIAKAVADTQSIQLDPDKSTGSLYFIPLTKEQSSIFIISESGETHAVTISPKERLIAQTIALKDTKLPNRHSQLSSNDQNALPYEDRIQRILRAIPSLSHEQAEVLKGTITDGYLIGNPV
ncbi:type-F conjugative transfer system secretin TraK, partial [uncultured Parasutterella sp.]